MVESLKKLHKCIPTKDPRPVGVRGGSPNVHSKNVIIFTDGSCSPNPGKGGWGVSCVTSKVILESNGGKMHTTNNEMEIYAFKMALEMVENGRTTIYSDSKYVVQSIGEKVVNGEIRGWLRKQLANGGTTSGNKPLKNLELWREIYAYIQRRRLTFDLKWTKGHSKEDTVLAMGNARADYLANKGREEL